MRDFNYPGACSQSIDEFICRCPIGRVKIRIPFIKQIDRIIGAIDDFLEHLQHSLPGRKTSFFTAIALRSVAILVFFLLVVVGIIVGITTGDTTYSSTSFGAASALVNAGAGSVR